ncbi:MAG: glycoside hydrolase family 125 protein [Chitinophagaceae bacterium]
MKHISRRKFIQATSLFGTYTSVFGMEKLLNNDMPFSQIAYTSMRPPLAERKFVSPIIDEVVQKTKKKIKNPKLAWMFENCFPNTLDTTVFYNEDNCMPDTFVITGDIDAMWLRDSAAQVYPYVVYAGQDKKLDLMLQGVINRQAQSIMLDPYANAFNKTPKKNEYTDYTEMQPEVFERKWELDSLCYPIRLAHHYWKTTKNTAPFNTEWLKVAKLIYQTMITQQRKKGLGDYSFQRLTTYSSETQYGRGYGNPINPVGLICSSFRPSDDATIFLFLIPSNLFAIKSLRQLAEIVSTIYKDNEFANQCIALANEVEKAVYKYSANEVYNFGKIMAFEVDGFGSQLYMDDANVPSLLALPYLGLLSEEDILYKNIRNFVWSKRNPYFYENDKFQGIGSPHVGKDNYIWPMSIIMKAFTTHNPVEIKHCLDMLINSDGNTGFMHESFLISNPKEFTRSWFAWANTLFGALVLNVLEKHKSIQL